MFNGLWQWKTGRQGSGYEKFFLAGNPFIVPFDLYLLRFRQGTHVPSHTDQVDGKRHYRINIVLKKAAQGGEFICSDPIYCSDRIKFFRPDQSEHSVTRIDSGTRYVLSLGWTLSGK